MSVTLENQLELEAEMMTGGIHRFRKALDAAVSGNREGQTKHGRAILSRIIEAVSEGVRDIQDNPKSNRDITHGLIKDMDAEQVAFIACVSLVDSLSKKTILLHVASTIGANIEIQDRLDKWIASEGSVAENTIKLAMKKGMTARRFGLTHKMNKDGYNHTQWSKTDRIHVGLRMVDVIIKTTGIIELTKQVISSKKTVNHIKATQGTEEWVKAFNEIAEVAKPMYAPCIIPPKEWTGVTGGGYHGKIIDELPIVRRS
jgi:DNA-directed RNA polymerase